MVHSMHGHKDYGVQHVREGTSNSRQICNTSPGQGQIWLVHNEFQSGTFTRATSQRDKLNKTNLQYLRELSWTSLNF